MYSRFAAPFAWILSFFVLLFIYTKFFGPIPFSINSVNTTKSTTFDVSGEGKVTVKPDSASISLGVRASAPTVKAAQDQMNQSINKVTQTVKNLGIDEKDITTANYNINPDYDFGGPLQKLKGYIAQTTINVKVRDIDKINNVLDAATYSGANEVSGIKFEVSDRSKLEDQAREMAVAEAKKKANSAAKIAGFRLGRIVNYAESPTAYPGPIPVVREAMQAGDSKQTSVEAGSTDITINIILSYEII